MLEKAGAIVDESARRRFHSRKPGRIAVLTHALIGAGLLDKAATNWHPANTIF